MTILGYGIGCWHGHNGVPQWIRDLAFPDATQALLLYHTEKDLRYTQGKHPVWILSNEFILDLDGAGLRNRQGRLDWGQYSPWAANTTDSSLYKAAFIKAREVDPDATLMLNDWDVEDIGWVKSEYLYQLVSDLKTEGTPIDGVGFQMHNFIDPNGKLVVFREVLPYTYTNTQRIDLDTYLENVDLNVKRYASIGMKVAFTEVEGQIKFDDIDLTTPAGRVEYENRLQWQARYFAGLLKIALENENVIMFHMWGGTDRHQNVQDFSGYGNGFIFDKNYNPKPAYDAMLELLKAP
jgi:endo-1,4-beta-xylanase